VIEAKYLKIKIVRDDVTTVDLSLPAKSCRWMMELIPNEVLLKIKERGIDLALIEEKFNNQKILFPEEIMVIKTEEKIISIYLE